MRRRRRSLKRGFSERVCPTRCGLDWKHSGWRLPFDRRRKRPEPLQAGTIHRRGWAFSTWQLPNASTGSCGPAVPATFRGSVRASIQFFIRRVRKRYQGSGRRGSVKIGKIGKSVGAKVCQESFGAGVRCRINIGPSGRPPGASAVPTGKLKERAIGVVARGDRDSGGTDRVRKLLGGKSMNVAFAMAVKSGAFWLNSADRLR